MTLITHKGCWGTGVLLHKCPSCPVKIPCTQENATSEPPPRSGPRRVVCLSHENGSLAFVPDSHLLLGSFPAWGVVFPQVAVLLENQM